jgi:hypothetical protein
VVPLRPGLGGIAEALPGYGLTAVADPRVDRLATRGLDVPGLNVGVWAGVILEISRASR